MGCGSGAGAGTSGGVAISVLWTGSQKIDLPVAAAIAGVVKIKVPGYREDMAELDCEKKMWELQRSK